MGAGLAGLAAAQLLQRQGIDVLVLEARSRVGGRVNTLDELPGHPEGGANVIGPNYGRVIDAAKSGDVKLHSPARSGETGFIINGQRILPDAWATSAANPLQGPMRALAPDRLLGAALRDNPLKTSSDWLNPRMAEYDLGVDSYLASLGFSDAAVSLVAANNSYGNSIQDTSMLSLLRVGNNFARARAMRQPVYEAARGNMRIPESIAQQFSGSIKFNVTVSRVERSGAEIIVQDLQGQQYHGDALIMALPLPALRNIQIDAMSEAQREAVTAVNYHKVTQVHLLVREPYWNDALPASWWTNGPLGRLFLRPSANPGEYANLTVWINGADCDRLAAMSEAEAGDTVRREVEAVLPEARGLLTTGKVLRWTDDPFAGGSWAVWAPGQLGRYFELLQQPLGRIFFAGEHTARANPGMEGAMESGERAALDSLRTLL
ncbi:amine oxidase [flavin-containing] A [gamma proteobacterium NOR5-3]|nr:amine oxidase [flavin-containing] A [gamma proteobacterium NOR5-3]